MASTKRIDLSAPPLLQFPHTEISIGHKLLALNIFQFLRTKERLFSTLVCKNWKRVITVLKKQCLLVPSHLHPILRFPHSDMSIGHKLLALNIFQFLQTKERLSSILACKNWKQVITNLKSECLFVRQLANVIYANPISKNIGNFSQYDYYLLGETHGNPLCKELYRELISSMASRYFVIVLVEGFPQRNPSSDLLFKRMIKWCMGFDSSSTENVHFLGWDTLECLQENQKLSQLQAFLNINQEKLILNLLIESISATPTRRIEIVNEIISSNLIIRYQLINEEKAMIERTFSSRTQSMADALVTVKNMHFQTTREIKVIVHCGNEHVQTSPDRVHNMAFNLDILYKTLAKLNAIVMTRS